MQVKKNKEKSKMSKKKKAAKKPQKKILAKKKVTAKKTKPVAKKKPAKKKPSQQQAMPRFEAESLFKAKIKVIGIGGGGGSIVSEIGRSLQKANFVIADTDFRAMKKKSGIKYFWFGQNFTHGLGTGLNTDLAREAAESEKEKISKLFLDQDIVILISSLGGGLGSGSARVFAEAAAASGAITLGIFTLPFKFEGKKKTKIANDSLRDLRRCLNVSITIPNERIFRVIDSNTPIMQAFSVVNKNLIESLESMIDLIYNPGLINIDFADLRTILKGKGNTAFLNTAEESGKDRAERICKNILTNPLYQNNNLVAEKILFNISGGDNLSMFEVEKISRSISDTNPKAKIIFGISKNPSLKNKIKATLLMTGPGNKADVAPDKVVQKVVVEKPVEPAVKVVVSEKVKPQKIKKHVVKTKVQSKEAVQKKVSVLVSEESAPKLTIVEPAANKKAIRRSALEIKKAEAAEENKRLLQEKEWEIPAFLRRVKFKS